jgi:hypothetical protein
MNEMLAMLALIGLLLVVVLVLEQALGGVLPVPRPVPRVTPRLGLEDPGAAAARSGWGQACREQGYREDMTDAELEAWLADKAVVQPRFGEEGGWNEPGNQRHQPYSAVGRAESPKASVTSIPLSSAPLPRPGALGGGGAVLRMPEARQPCGYLARDGEPCPLHAAAGDIDLDAVASMVNGWRVPPGAVWP